MKAYLVECCHQERDSPRSPNYVLPRSGRANGPCRAASELLDVVHTYQCRADPSNRPIRSKLGPLHQQLLAHRARSSTPAHFRRSADGDVSCRSFRDVPFSASLPAVAPIRLAGNTGHIGRTQYDQTLATAQTSTMGARRSSDPSSVGHVRLRQYWWVRGFFWRSGHGSGARREQPGR